MSKVKLGGSDICELGYLYVFRVEVNSLRNCLVGHNQYLCIIAKTPISPFCYIFVNK